jgi:hypothetical protein
VSENAAFAYPCPACQAPADLARGCPTCGRGPDPDAAEVVRLDRVIAELVVRERWHREAHAAALAELTDTRRRREAAAARVRVARTVRPPAPTPPPSPPPSPSPAPEPVPVPVPVPPGPEASTFSIQTLLFIIGGLLLGTGAIAFTVVAWTTFGRAGQAAILAVVTLLVLAVPAVAQRRGLRGTAETFAVLGLLLVLLDGYAAWRVGLVGDLPATTWAGLVCGVTALVAVPYARRARPGGGGAPRSGAGGVSLGGGAPRSGAGGGSLAGPGFAGLVLAQPVLPLLAAEPVLRLSGAAPRLAALGWLLAVLAAGNLAIRWRLGTPGTGRGLRILSWALTAAALATAAATAVLAMFVAADPGPAGLAGGALVAAGAVLAGVAGLAGTDRWWTAAAAAPVLAVALAGARVVALAWPGLALVGVAVVVAVTALPVLAGGRATPVRRGLWIGGLVPVAAVGPYLAGLALWSALTAVWLALTGAGAGAYDWQLPAALLVLTGALAWLVPGWRREAAAAGLALTVLAVPPAFGLAWWAPPVVDLAVAAGLALAAVRAGTVRRAAVGAGTAALLAGHALAVGLATAAGTAAVLGALTVLGVALGWLARGRSSSTAVVIGRTALLVGLLAWPGAVTATVMAAGAPAPWPARAALLAAASLLVAVAAAGRAAPGYRPTAAAAVHAVTPVAFIAGLWEGPATVGAYAAGAALVLAALGLLHPPAHRDGWLAVRMPAVLAAAVLAAPQLAVVLAGPYSWLGDIWAGAPAEVGLLAGGGWPGNGPAALGLALLTVAAGFAGRVLAGRWSWALLVAPVAVLVGLAELGAAWPVVPAVSLLLGVAGVLWGTRWSAALSGAGAQRLRPAPAPGSGAGAEATDLAPGYGLVLVGAGLAGGLPERWSTLTGLGVALVVASVVGAVGRTRVARIAGWPAAVAAAVLLAIAATRAADLPLPTAAFAVLAACAVAVAAAALLRSRTHEALALEAAAVGGAVVAVLLAGERIAVVAALAAIILTAGWLVRRPAWDWQRWAPALLAAVVPVAAVPQLAVVLAGPYSWLGDVWAGAPGEVGLLAGGGWPGNGPAALGLALLTVAAGFAGRVLAGRWSWALLVAPVAVLVGLAELGTEWPVVPAASLLLGAAGVLWATRWSAGYGLVLVGPGLAGGLPERWSTLTGLGVALVVASVVGAVGRTRVARIAGWPAAVAAAVLLAIAATRAGDLPLRSTAFAVLGVAAAALAVAGTIRSRRTESVALEAAAHAGALVAFLLSVDSITRTATVAALWGSALAVRVVWRGEPRAAKSVASAPAPLPGAGAGRSRCAPAPDKASGRVWRAAAATGCELLAWWLLLASRQVAAVEAYTLPAALAALAAGWWARRSRPELGSWAAYGPALAAVSLPSFYLVLVDPVPLRRLLLGAAAVAVVVAGARRRLQAPVMVGGAVAVLVAVRELGLVWQLLDTWIPLTVAGLILVGMAATYERRRRDLARLRVAVRHMT